MYLLYLSTWKIIGLAFAGNTFDGFACRIDDVASELGIQAWDGTTKNYLNLATKQSSLIIIVLYIHKGLFPKYIIHIMKIWFKWTE